MAAQGDAWERATKKLKSSQALSTSEVISPKREKFYLFETHESTTEQLAWNLFGKTLLTSTVISAIAAYATLIFVTVVLPEIQAYTKKLEASIMSNTNSTDTRRLLAVDASVAVALGLEERLAALPLRALADDGLVSSEVYDARCVEILRENGL